MRLRCLALGALLVVGACGGGNSGASSGGPVRVVAAENFWGDIASQLGGAHVTVTSLISDPEADPHLFESDAKAASAIANAAVVIENGMGYDDFVSDLLANAPASTRVVSAGDVLHENESNPHVWYDTARVPEVARAIVAELVAVDPDHKATFDANLSRFEGSLRPILDTIERIKTKYPGAPVAYTERVPGYLLRAAGLVVKSPPGFAESIEEGNEPSARDTDAMNTLMSEHGVEVLCYNAQAASAVTEHVQDLARQSGIPVVGFTETVPKGEADYQSWQLHQAQALLAALGG